MPVRLLRGYFMRFDGFVGDDLEALAVGVVTTIPQVTGTPGCILLEGSFFAR